jgi:two-component system KDP operon response regulator KdpE
MSSARILVVDDAPQVRRVLRATLAAEGYTVSEARDGREAVGLFSAEPFDIILLDANMPEMGGLETCREIRGRSDVPIIMLTVRDAERDKVRALDAGADDYVVKPFGMEELLARIRAALRRTSLHDKLPEFVSKELNIDFEARRVTARGEEVHLTPKEFELLRQLVASQGKPLTHRRLLQAVWGPDHGEETDYLRVTINQLRKKLEPDPAHPRFILTEPWVGYRFEPHEKSKRK